MAALGHNARNHERHHLRHHLCHHIAITVALKERDNVVCTAFVEHKIIASLKVISALMKNERAIEQYGTAKYAARAIG